MKKKQEKSDKQWIFVLVALLIYASVYFIAPDKVLPIWISFWKIIRQIAPILIVVYLIMLLTNYFVDNQHLQKYMSENVGYKAWGISILAGILSVGPIYIWYPLLKDLQDKGVKDKYLATFLYNRGIKLQWLPVLLLYFGWKYALVLLIVMTILSIFQGIITERLSSKIKNNF